MQNTIGLFSSLQSVQNMSTQHMGVCNLCPGLRRWQLVAQPTFAKTDSHSQRIPHPLCVQRLPHTKHSSAADSHALTCRLRPTMPKDALPTPTNLPVSSPEDTAVTAALHISLHGHGPDSTTAA